ncbi:MAG: 2OG-Fe dioxygenase family protein, partial [Patescibacteria group bacterium]
MNNVATVHGRTICCGIDDEITYVLDEKAIFSDLGLSMRWPLRIFNLQGMGIDQRAFIAHMAPTFQTLAWDEYDMRRGQMYFLHGAFPGEQRRLEAFNRMYYAGKCDTSGIVDLITALSPERRKEFDRITPHRRRSLARFRVRKVSEHCWNVVRISAGDYSQSQGGDDFREAARTFQEMDRKVTVYPSFTKLLMRFGQIVERIHGHPEYLEINAHQMTTIARHGKFGDGAPEGIHQDGMDYIVSALVIERKHIHGGMSYVYGSDKKTLYLHTTLRPGFGIFQTDIESPFWHAVTPIYLDPHANEAVGERSIMGF